MLPQLILPNQTSFVPSRHIHDNVIIAQQAIHSISKFRGKHENMTLKIDHENVYDRLKWSFIEETIHMLGIPVPMT